MTNIRKPALFAVFSLVASLWAPTVLAGLSDWKCVTQNECFRAYNYTFNVEEDAPDDTPNVSHSVMAFAGFKATGLSVADIDYCSTTSIFYRDGVHVGTYNTDCTDAAGQSSHTDYAGLWSASCGKPLVMRTTVKMRIRGRLHTSTVAVARERPCG